jgi:acetyltransferase-like isoleucine patch superfamily enzyme
MVQPEKVTIHKSAILYGKNSIGEGNRIMENVILGYPDRELLNKMKRGKGEVGDYLYQGVTTGENALIRSGTIIYCNVRIGDNLQTGHRVLIRENTSIGDNVLIGTNVVIEGNTLIGNRVSIQSNVYIPVNSVIEDFVFIGPNAVLTNDKYPLRKKEGELKGPILRKGASIGANSTILPGIEIGEGAMVAAGALVTKHVAPWKLAIGSPARVIELPEEMRKLNRI